MAFPNTNNYTHMNLWSGYYQDVPHNTLSCSFVTGSYSVYELVVGKRYRVVSDTECYMRLEMSATGSIQTDFYLPGDIIDSFITHVNYHFLHVIGDWQAGTIWLTQMN